MSAAALDEAFRGYAIVKASRMRITVHAVAVEDRAPFHAAMRSTLRAAGSYDVRFAAAGLTIADADALVPRLLTFAGRPRPPWPTRRCPTRTRRRRRACCRCGARCCSPTPTAVGCSAAER